MNWEPDDAEVHYLAHNVEESLYLFRPRSNRRGCAGPSPPTTRISSREGVDGFLDALDVSAATRCGSPIAGGTARRSTSSRARATSTSPVLFRQLDARGFEGHYMNAFGTLQDMIEGRETLAKMA